VTKIVIIGIGIAVIIGIVAVLAVTSMQLSNTESISDKIVDETIPEEETVIEETTPEEETVIEETTPEEETEVGGRELSVELTESINLKSP